MPENASTSTLDRIPPSAPPTWTLPPETLAQLTELASDLDGLAQELRDRWSEKSERWQEGDTGSGVDGWIDTVLDLAESLENFPATPDDA